MHKGSIQGIKSKYHFVGMMMWHGILCKKIKPTTMSQQQYQECIEACRACATLCQQCASACLLEEDVKSMTRCIQLDLECATLCNAAAQVMSLNGELSEQLCQLCESICNSCAE